MQVGGTITVAVDGDDLGKAPKLLLPFAAKQTLKPGDKVPLVLSVQSSGTSLTTVKIEAEVRAGAAAEAHGH